MAYLFDISSFMSEYPMLYSYFEILVGWKVEEINKHVLIEMVKGCDAKALIKLIAMDYKVIGEPFASEKKIKLIKKYRNSTGSKKKEEVKDLLRSLYNAELGELQPLPGRLSPVKAEKPVLDAMLALLVREIFKIKQELDKRKNTELFPKHDKNLLTIVRLIAKNIIPDKDIDASMSAKAASTYIKDSIKAEKPLNLAIQILANMCEIKQRSMSSKISNDMIRSLRKKT